MALTERQCRALACPDKITRIADGNGLSLVLHPNGSRYWHGRYRHQGKEQTKSIGQYPDISLASARAIWAQFKKDVVNMEKPRVTFAQAYDKYLAWRRTQGFATDACIHYGYSKLPDSLLSTMVDEITPSQVSATLEHVIKTCAKSAPAKAYSVLRLVFEFSIDLGYCQTNPAGRASRLVPKYVTTHHKSMSPDQVGRYLSLVHTMFYQSRTLAYYFAMLSLLTCVRYSELLHVRWQDIDEQERVWRIPAEFMKMNRPHDVPLSTQALKLFRELREVQRTDELFINAKGGQFKARHALGKLHRALALEGVHHTTHGNRALLATVGQEILGFPYIVIDRQLAHVSGSAIEQAYNRAQFMQERINLMQQWADWVEEQATTI